MFSALGKMLKAIFKKIFAFVKKLFKAIWPLLIIFAVIWFAPAITAYLTSVGAPSFLTSAFSSISALTPELVSAVSWLSSTSGQLLSTGWSAFKAAEIGTQLSIVAGAAALIAPEETAEFLEEVVETVVGAVGAVVGAVASGFFSSPIGALAVAAGVWWFFFKDSDERQPQQLGVN